MAKAPVFAINNWRLSEGSDRTNSSLDTTSIRSNQGALTKLPTRCQVRSLKAALFYSGQAAIAGMPLASGSQWSKADLLKSLPNQLSGLAIVYHSRQSPVTDTIDDLINYREGNKKPFAGSGHLAKSVWNLRVETHAI